MYRICTLAPLRIIKSIIDNSVHTRGDLDCSIFPEISLISLITDMSDIAVIYFCGNLSRRWRRISFYSHINVRLTKYLNIFVNHRYLVDEISL